MRHALLALLLVLAACGEASPEPAAAERAAEGPCRQLLFDDSRFTVCDPGKGRIELVAAARGEPPIRDFAALEAKLGDRAATVAFAMNAGMFGEDGRPIGLAIVDGREVRAINRRKGGGNFHLMPNGVFQTRRDGRAEIVTSDKWQAASDIRLATQSGPMLVISGKLHPAFDRDGSSRHIRNGVGISANGRALFAISETPVSLGKFARFFRDRLKCRDALFFDGAVSALWDPVNHRRDVIVPLGPMIVAFKPAASKPDREAPAKS